MPPIKWQQSNASVALLEGSPPEYWVDVARDSDDVFRLNSSENELLFQGRFSADGQPEGQQIYFWPNGNLREFATWYEGRIVGTRACYFENGYLEKEEHYSCNGSLTGSGILVRYRENGMLAEITKMHNQTPTGNIVDPDTLEPFGSSLKIQIGRQPKQ